MYIPLGLGKRHMLSYNTFFTKDTQEALSSSDKQLIRWVEKQPFPSEYLVFIIRLDAMSTCVKNATWRIGSISLWDYATKTKAILT